MVKVHIFSYKNCYFYLQVSNHHNFFFKVTLTLLLCLKNRIYFQYNFKKRYNFKQSYYFYLQVSKQCKFFSLKLCKHCCFRFRFKYSFIQGTSTRRQRRDLFGLQVKLPPVTTSLPCLRTQQANLPAYLHTNPYKC